MRKGALALAGYFRGLKDNTATPKLLYEQLDAEFHFDYDPCPINPEGLRSQDGLGGEWGKRNYVNPPYSNKVPWIKKAIEEQGKGKRCWNGSWENGRVGKMKAESVPMVVGLNPTPPENLRSISWPPTKKKLKQT